ncbi:MAG: EamA family transporter [Christensenellales bacterium]
MWIVASVLSAVFAGITSILAKCGIRKTDSDVASALRTSIVLLFSAVAVCVVGSYVQIPSISVKSWIFLVLSGLATGASWLCYFRALSLGDVNKVAPVDKSSTIITVLLAILIFNETKYWFVKIIGCALIAAGTFLMAKKSADGEKTKNSRWLFFALLSALFAALSSILAKIGVENVESNLGTAIRTVVVLVLSFIVVFARHKQADIKTIDKKELFFIFLSGVATGASWLCYYYAIQKGKVSVVVPIDKLSILVTVLFSAIVFKEKLSVKATVGLVLITVGTVGMAIFS